MKKVVLKFGLYAGLIMLLMGAIQLSLIGTMTAENYERQELFGYVSIVVSLVFIYFGIRYYRDNVNGGVITFWQAIKLGLLITLFPSAAFGFLDTLYSHVINPGFAEHCIAIQEQIIKKNVPAAEVPQKIADMKKMMETFKNPFLGWLFMFFTVFPIGLIISVISALILQRKNTITGTD